ncbi:hypothetical protein H0H93_005491, partial [Arthromyces matolae]
HGHPSLQPTLTDGDLMSLRNLVVFLKLLLLLLLNHQLPDSSLSSNSSNSNNNNSHSNISSNNINSSTVARSLHMDPLRLRRSLRLTASS